MDAGEEVPGAFVVSCCDASELLEFVEEALDEIALLVERLVVGSRREAIAFGRDDDRCFAGPQLVDQAIRVERPVGDQRAGLKAVEKRFAGLEVVDLPGRERKSDGIAERVHQRAELAGQASPAAADGLVLAPFFRAPAAW